ncbi:MAG: type III-B CRISPR module-associated protein Cmr3 [Planctomycetes bacterium]|nr:type III-B CRISPR module-associated protein Cmr3 [Planctomycetota bacterium]
MNTIGLNLQPLDTLFFRDGRPFEAATQAASGLPLPQTLAGALRTWLLRRAGCDFEKLAQAMEQAKKNDKGFAEAVANGQNSEVAAIGKLRFRGPWFALNGQPLVPAPAILHQIKDSEEIVRLAPLKTRLPGWNPPSPGMLPLWWKGNKPTERLDGYLTRSGLQKFLDGNTPEKDKKDILEASDLFDFDRRVGIGVEPENLTAEEGQIYAVSLLALKKEVTLYAEIDAPEEALKLFPHQEAAVPIPLGGEGRRVALERIEPVCWPIASPSEGRALLLLTTPAFFDVRRAGLRQYQAIAAAVPGYEAVSGWDLAKRGPKPTRFAVKAGSVYFLEKPLNPAPPSLCEGEDAALGWGGFVTGGWNYA